MQTLAWRGGFSNDKPLALSFNALLIECGERFEFLRGYATAYPPKCKPDQA
jgi:hypothetical protein